jgi:hypothetical protein
MTEADELQFKTTEDVAYRALALVALAYRMGADASFHAKKNVPRAKQSLEQVRAWISAEGIDVHLTDAERRTIARPLGELEDAVLDYCLWRIQALAAILWALRKIDSKASYDESVDFTTLLPLVPFGQPISEFQATIALRSEEELVTERHRAEFWHGRANAELFRRGRMKSPTEAEIAQMVQTALEEGIIAEVQDGDAICKGKPYRALSEEAFEDAALTAKERLHALNWICGCVEDWDDSDT